MIKVGNVKFRKLKVVPDKIKPLRIEVYYSYKDVEYDNDGWADAEKYLPEDYDLVSMKTKDKKVIPGWSTKKGWFGLRLASKDKVVLWKRKFEERE